MGAGGATVVDFGGRPGRFLVLDGRALLEMGNLLSQHCSTILAGIGTILRTFVRFTNESISLKNTGLESPRIVQVYRESRIKFHVRLQLTFGIS